MRIVLHGNNISLYSHLKAIFQPIINNFTNMPYRRLPNTDSARLKSLEGSLRKRKRPSAFQACFQLPTPLEIYKRCFPCSRMPSHEHKNALNIQAEKNKEYQRRLKKGSAVYFTFHPGGQPGHMRGDLLPDTRTISAWKKKKRKCPPWFRKRK